MRTREVVVSCDLCDSRVDVATMRIRIPPNSAVEIDLCPSCRRSATAAEAIKAGRPLPSWRPFEDVITKVGLL